MCFSKTAIDEIMWQIESYLVDKYGCDKGQREMYPLYWYIYTGRASTDFLKKLCTSNPFMIGRILHKNGSCSEVIERVKKYVERENKNVRLADKIVEV